MIERTIRKYLANKLEYPVTFEVQKNPPEQFYILEKTGGGCENMVYTSTLAIQSYADKMADAMLMNEALKEAMNGIMELDEICNVDLNSDYNFTDTSQKKYRYQAVFDVIHY